MPFIDDIMIDDRRVGLWSAGDALDPNRPTLILLHGTAGSQMVFRALARLLDRAVNALAPDLPGHGQSEGPPLRSISEMAHWVLDVIRTLHLPRPPFVGGLSLGGAVAIETALIEPQEAAGLVLISTAAAFHSPKEFEDRLRADSRAALKSFARAVHGAQANPMLIRQSEALLAEIPIEVLLADLEASRGFDRRDSLSRIRVPALVVCGDRDSVTPPEMSAQLADGLPMGRLALIEGGGHMAVVEQYREAGRLILDFIRGPDGGAF